MKKKLLIKSIVFIWIMILSNSIYAQPPGNALNFDGIDDYVSIQNDPLLNFNSSAFTVETWVKIIDFGSGYNVFVGKALPTGSGSIGWQLGYLDQKLTAEINDGANNITIQGTTFLEINTWYHIALVVDPTIESAIIYLNGMLEASESNPLLTNSLDNDNELKIGTNRDGYPLVQGEFDEIRIWNYARTACQINNAYQYELVGDELGLVAYYPFNQGIPGSDNTAEDFLMDNTSNGLNGLLYGFELQSIFSNWVFSEAGVTYENLPLSVCSIVPWNGQMDVSQSADIFVEFDDEIFSSSVNNSSFVVTGSSSGNITGTFSVTGREITFTPDFNYSPGETVNVSMTTDIHTVNGKYLPADYSWSFSVTEANGGFEVVTHDVINITEIDAQVVCEILDDGGNPVTISGVCWNETGNPIVGTDQFTTNGLTGGLGTYTNTLTGLSSNTTYYVRAYATNSIETVYGLELSFTTNAESNVPEVNTGAYSNVTTNSADVAYSIVTDNGSPINASGVCWNTTGTPTIGDFFNNDANITPGTYSTYLSGLAPNTTYYVRAYASNNNGEGYGQEISFTTSPEVNFEVIIHDVVNQSDIDAVIECEIVDDGGSEVTVSGVCWNTTGNPNIDDDNYSTDGLVATTGVFSTTMTALTPNTTYYVKAYATNSIETVYSSEISLTTNESGQLMPPGNALSFDGENDFVNINHDTQLNFGTNSFTVECWIQPNMLDAGYKGIISKRSIAGWEIAIDNGYLTAFLSDGTENTTIQSPSPLSVNEWIFVSLIVDHTNSNAALLIDGNIVAETNMAFIVNSFDNGSPINIGTDYQSMYFANATIDEIRIWNYSKEVCEIYNTATTELIGDETGLIAYYNCNAGVGEGDNTGLTNLDDITTYGNVGTLNNFALIELTSNWVTSGATLNDVGIYGDFEPVGIITQPTTVSATVGSDVQFMVDAVGNPINYQWYKDGAELAAETSNYLNLYGVTELDAVDYYCVVSNECSMQQSALATIQIITCDLSVDISATQNPVCFGETGELTAVVSGGTSPYTYEWTNGATTEFVENLMPGTYSVTISDINGCEATAELTLDENTEIIATATITNESFGGANDGAIELAVFGGIEPYSFLWNDNSTTQDLFDIPSGDYSVTITDDFGCQIYETYSVTVGDCVYPIIDEVTASVDEYCSGETVELTITGTLNDAAHWVLYDGTMTQLDNTTGNTFYVNPEGDETYAIRGEGNCVNTGNYYYISLTEDQTAPVPDMASLDPIVDDCYYEIVDFPTATDNCDGQITGTTSDPLIYDTQGTFTVTWTYTDNNGNQVMQYQEITINVNNAVITAEAGDYIELNSTDEIIEFNLAATPVDYPSVGTWTHSNEGAVVIEPTLYNSLVNSILSGHQTYIWTVELGACQSSDLVNVFLNRTIVNSGAKGTWDNTQSWLPAVIPSEYDIVKITNGTVDLVDFAADAASVEIFDGGILNIEGGVTKGDASLTVGNIDIYQTTDVKGVANANVRSGGRLYIEQNAEKGSPGNVNVRSGGRLYIEQNAEKATLSDPFVQVGGVLNIIEDNQLLTDASAIVNIGNNGQIEIAGTSGTKSVDKVILTGEANLFINQNTVSAVPALSVLQGGNVLIGNTSTKTKGNANVKVSGGRLYIEQNAEKSVSGNVNIKSGGRLYIEQNAEKSDVESSVETPQMTIENGNLIIGDQTGTNVGEANLITANISVVQSTKNKTGNPNIVVASGGNINLYQIPELGNETFIQLGDNGSAEFTHNAEIYSDNATIPIVLLSEMSSIIDNTDDGMAINGLIEFSRTYTVGSYFFGSPISDLATDDFTANLISSWSEEANDWTLLATSSNISSQSGYLLNYFMDNTEELVGTPNIAVSTVNLTNTNLNNPNISGWNLIGNPYMSAIDWETITLSSGVENTLYKYDTETNNFTYYQQGGATINGGSQMINLSDAFYVKVAPTQASSTFDFEEGKVHNIPGLLNLQIPDDKLTTETLTLTLTDGSNSDQTIFGLETDADINFEHNKDIFKLMSDIPQLYSVTENNEYLAMNIFDVADQEVVYIPLNVLAQTNSNFTINSELMISNTAINVYLHDLSTDQYIDLRQETLYNFDYETSQIERFELIFGYIVINTNEVENGNVEIYSFNDQLFVNNTSADNYKLEVYSALGVKVYDNFVYGQGKHSYLVDFEIGVYFVKLSNGEETKTQKVIIKR